MIGRLFQRQEVRKDRSEIIIVLIPRVLPYCGHYAMYEQGEIGRTGTPLFEGPLLRKRRPWMPKLPDAVTNPRILRFPPIGKTYPHPAYPVEEAATPQAQDNYPIPARPAPGFRNGLPPECCNDPIGVGELVDGVEALNSPTFVPEAGSPLEFVPRPNPTETPRSPDIEGEPAAQPLPPLSRYDSAGQRQRRRRGSVFSWWTQGSRPSGPTAEKAASPVEPASYTPSSRPAEGPPAAPVIRLPSVGTAER
jgi:hypothetical protein